MGFTLLFVTIFLIHLVLRNEIVVGKEKAKKKKRREKFQTIGIGLS